MAEIRNIVFDAHHALNLAMFWGEVLDSHKAPTLDDDGRKWLIERGIDPDNPPYLGLDPVNDGEARVWFNVVPDPTPGKNRLHLDVNLKDRGELQHILDLGATVIAEPDQRGGDFWVLADPEGNQFCAFPPKS